MLRAMGVPPNWIQGTVRFSLSCYSTEEEVRFVSENMSSVVQRLRELSGPGKLGKTNDGQEAERSDSRTADRVGVRE